MLRETVMLNTVDLSKAIGQDEFEILLDANRASLSLLANQIYLQQRPIVIVLEGWDLAENNEAIQLVVESMDPRGFRVYPSLSPGNERITGFTDDATHHYLWRFWRRIPMTGQIAIFEDSWYQRVLSERVEGLCSVDAWKRAFREINQFERQLVDFGTIVFKFWLHISLDEQASRLEASSNDEQSVRMARKDDWYNLEKRAVYEAAVDEMLLKTSTTLAPWKVVAGNSRYYGQIEILQTLVKELSQELDYNVSSIKVSSPGGKKKKISRQKAKKKEKTKTRE